MKRFYIFNAGCIRRAVDAILIKNYLQANGWERIDSPRKADLLIIGTCGVVMDNEQKSLQAIAYADKRRRPDSTLVVTGCLPKIHPEAINELGQFVFIPSGWLGLFDPQIRAEVPIAEVRMPDTIRDGSPIIEYLMARSFCRKSRLYRWLFARLAMHTWFLKLSVRKMKPYYNIKIADGCLHNCSYCATRFATGFLVSRTVDDILREFKRGLQRGYKTFQLISEDTGCYGTDIDSSLPELLEKMTDIGGDYQLIVIDYNPLWLIKHKEQLVRLLKERGDKFKELFVPIQSGSDKILKAMNRGHTAVEAEEALMAVHATGVALRTTVLVGFPGEDWSDFMDTVCLAERVPFAEVTINRYEDRPNTEASKMENKLPQEVIEHRAQLLVKWHGWELLS